jgi:hypothetical protein
VTDGIIGYALLIAEKPVRTTDADTGTHR